MSIYVEILLRAPIEDVWRLTQTPALHQRWDLRFTAIVPTGASHQGEAATFRYSTRIGLGMTIDGEGESVGHRDLGDGSRASALRFWSHHPLSLIREGRGYWKYVPTPDGVRFLTGYDYRVRFGLPGRLIDRLLFRPWLGWATAWSFDRLRLWLERGADPGILVRQAAIHAVARIGLAAVFLYHGAVPKLLTLHPDELAIVGDAGLAHGVALVRGLGVAEVVFGLLLLARWRSQVLPLIAATFALGALAAVAAVSPRYLGGAFNPVTLDLAVVGLAAIDRLASGGLPTAARCLRRPPGGST